jgi:hypothetical protein
MESWNDETSGEVRAFYTPFLGWKDWIWDLAGH